MHKGGIKKFFNDNLVLIVCVPLIIGFHWGWTKIQENPKLIDQNHRKELPTTVVREKFQFLDIVSPTIFPFS